MNRFYSSGCMLLIGTLLPLSASAQLSSNPDKFLGNITTSYQVDYGNEKFYQLWNQITPENESKWSSIEGTRGSFNWASDASYNYAKQHGFLYKHHCLIWGSQYPSWMDNLSTAEQYKEVVKWMDALKKHYPNLEMIDVVNEAISGHAPAPYKDALGGDGKTGYDWIIKSFEMAHERWPEAILIYNDYNTFRWQKTEFINLVKTLRDAGAPIDAYGCQSHDLTDMSQSDFKSAMAEIQNALKMPMYITEYDIGTSDDAYQKQRYQEQIPLMWEADYCAGVTIWGYIYGHTWTTDGNSGIIRDGKDRPAMTWLREYMKSEKAQTAKSPFPGMKKEASVYIKPSAIAVTKNDTVSILIDASLRTKTIDSINFYVKNKLYCTLKEAPYEVKYVPTVEGRHDLKAVAYATDGSKYERLGGFTAYKPRKAYKDGAELPGTLQAENFDSGAEGMAYHDSDTKDEGGTSYRSDNGGVDIVTGNGGYAIGYTSSGEWLEYTVNVTKAGVYKYEAYVSSGVTSSSFSMSLSTDEGLESLTESLTVPCVKSNDWSTYRTLQGRLLIPLEEGQQVIRINITGSSCNIDKIVFTHLNIDPDFKLSIGYAPEQAIVGEDVTISVAAEDGRAISKVNFYKGDNIVKSVESEPFEYTFKPTASGDVTYTIEAFDTEGRMTDLTDYTLTSYYRHEPFKSMSIPGTVEAEDFDCGGDGISFHDSDSEDEEQVGYRKDNEGVDITESNGGHVIGYTVTNEWLEYTVNVTEAGKYKVKATVSSIYDDTGFTISRVDDGKLTKLCSVKVPKTGDWSNYRIKSANLSKALDEGTVTLRITVTASNFNLDKMEFICTEPAGIEGVDADAENGSAYDLSGRKVDADSKGIIIIDGKKSFRK